MERCAWLQRPDTDLAEEAAQEAEWAEANDHQGPHCLIGQPEMRMFWWRCFGRQEEVTWDAFWSRFPKDVNRRAFATMRKTPPHITSCMVMGKHSDIGKSPHLHKQEVNLTALPFRYSRPTARGTLDLTSREGCQPNRSDDWPSKE